MPGDLLARISDDPRLARAVPRLPPEMLHAVIAHRGLQDCGELLALATPAQLTAVFDLDLWKPAADGAAEQFDAARFREWIETLAGVGAEVAADRLADMDPALVVAGLAPAIAVYDPGVFEPVTERDSADPVLNPGTERGVHADIGGYVVVSHHGDAWDAIVETLVTLAERHADAFHRIMRGCRRLSNDGRELDGLDDLLPDDGQAVFDLSLSREQRRDRLGFLPPQQAHAFLTAARSFPLEGQPPAASPVFAAYRRTAAVTRDAEEQDAAQRVATDVSETPAEDASSVSQLVGVLREAGVLTERPRALLATPEDDAPPAHAALAAYLRNRAERNDVGWMEVNEALAFLTNALVAGCRVQDRALTAQEAAEAVTATCNLALECWPPQWNAAVDHDLVTLFQAGWSMLHRDVCMHAAQRLAESLDDIRSSDRDLEMGLFVLRRELRKWSRKSTPWRARHSLDVLASLDMPTWAALLALVAECPVMLANVNPPAGRPPRTMNPADFQFVATAAHLAAVHAFLTSLTDRLVQ
jgi:uncharacterized protein DUF6178